MKAIKWTKLAMALTTCMFVFTACDDDDDRYQAPGSVQAAFNAQYPNASRIEYDFTRSGYVVVEFWDNGQEKEAWYTFDGTWKFTETELGLILESSGLPTIVIASFNESGYAGRRIDDIDRIEKANGELYYLIEIDNEPSDIVLHYSEDGTFIAETDENGRYTSYLN